MSKPIIAIKMYARNYAGLVNLGNSVHEGLTGNPDFTAPAPALITLRVAIDDVIAAMAEWGVAGNRGSHVALTDLRMKAQTLLQLLNSESKYVAKTAQTACGNDYVQMESLLLTTGFGLRNKNKPQGVIEKVQNLHRVVSRRLNANRVKLQWSKPLNLNSALNVKSYIVFKGTTADFSTAVQFASVAKTRFYDTNETGDFQTWWYWVVPMNNAGYGVASESLMAQVVGA